MVNRILLSLLAGLYPALFFASNNWFTFTGPQLAFLIVGMSLITTALIFFLAMIFAKLVAQFIGKNKATRIVNRLTDCFCSAFAFSLCAFLFRPVYTTLSLPTIRRIWVSPLREKTTTNFGISAARSGLVERLSAALAGLHS